MPSSSSSAASAASASTESWAIPGMDSIGSRTPSPGRTKSGYTKSRGSSVVSRTRSRSVDVRRQRRGRRAPGPACTPSIGSVST